MLSRVVKSLRATSSSRPPRCGCSSWARATLPLAAMVPASATTSARAPNSLRTTHLLLQLALRVYPWPVCCDHGPAAGGRRPAGRSGRCPRHAPCRGAGRCDHPRACRACTPGRRHLRHGLRTLHGRARGPRDHPLCGPWPTALGHPRSRQRGGRGGAGRCHRGGREGQGAALRWCQLAGERPAGAEPGPGGLPDPALLGQLGFHARRRAARLVPGLWRPHQLLRPQPAGHGT